MSCNKCSEKFILKNSDGIIFFISEIDELVRKSEQFLGKSNLNFENLQGLLSIRGKKCK